MWVDGKLYPSTKLSMIISYFCSCLLHELVRSLTQLRPPNTILQFNKLVIHLENSGLEASFFVFGEETHNFCDDEINLHVKTVA